MIQGLRLILQDYPPTPTIRWLQAYVESYDRWTPVNHMLEQLDKMTRSLESFIDPQAYKATYGGNSGGMYGFGKGLTHG